MGVRQNFIYSLLLLAGRIVDLLLDGVRHAFQPQVVIASLVNSLAHLVGRTNETLRNVRLRDIACRVPTALRHVIVLLS